MVEIIEHLCIREESLELEYFLVPWDTRICNFPVAQIQNIRVIDDSKADLAFDKFLHWRDQLNVSFCSCRMASSKLKESLLLQRNGYFFVEMNYQPEFNNLQDKVISLKDMNDLVDIKPVSGNDIDIIAGIARKSFTWERFHIDPFLGQNLGNLRYETWVRNSFKNPNHQLLKIIIDNIIAGFFIIEYKLNHECYWHLTALGPDYQGCGLGSVVWKKVLGYVQEHGAKTVKTTISTRNTAVLSIYAKLGFRLPLPSMTFHWHLR